MVMEDCGRVKPRSFLEQRVSERVFITVRKMTTLRGSPWYTPISRGTGSVDHVSVEIVAVTATDGRTLEERSSAPGRTG